MSEKQPCKSEVVPTIVAELSSGALVELVYNAKQQETALAVWDKGAWRLEQKVPDNDTVLVPYSANNNLVSNDVVLFPSMPEEYGDVMQLIADIRSFIHRYVDLHESF